MKNEKLKAFFSSAPGKSLVVASAVLLIGLAVYLNYRWFYDPLDSIGYGTSNMTDAQQASAPAEDNSVTYFTATTLSRTQSRDEAIDVLKLVTNNEESSADAKAQAANQISQIAVNIQNEANIESLVKAKGFEDCVAIIGNDTVSVVVKAESLQASQAAQIMSIVYETTGISPEKVTVLTK